MACSRCGDDCTCACSGNPLPQLDWRMEISKQVSAHRARRKRKADPDAPLLDFEETVAAAAQPHTPRVPASAWWTQTPVESPATTAPVRDPFADEPAPAVHQERPVEHQQTIEKEEEPYIPPEMRPPLPPFPRVSRRAPKKIIEFPRVAPLAYEEPDPVADQLRIFEAEETPPPPPSHFADIEIAPEEPAHLIATEQLELPLQPASLAARRNAALLDAVMILSASALFAVTAKLFLGPVGLSKSIIAAAAACGLLLLSIYYLLSFSYSRATVGMQATGLWLSTFAGEMPSRTALRCRALAITLSCAALGMGFAWSLIDEDRLCWHDRITHTYLRQG